MSDFHLGADLSYAEINTNLISLEKLLNQVRIAPNVKELVIAGDLLDEWFVPANVNTYQGGSQNDFVQRIATTNQIVITALNNIIQDGNILVTYLPGNHDLTITAANVESILPGINQARGDEQGVGTYSPVGYPQIAIEHGHRYNFFCSPDPISNQAIVPGSIMPPGYFFTRFAALHVVQNCHAAGDTLPVVTPNSSGGASQHSAFLYWNNWKALITALPIENRFDEPILKTNLNGFTQTYAVNDILPHQSTAGGLIEMNLFHGIQDTWEERQTLNHVAVHIPVDEAIINSNSDSFTDQQAVTQYFMNPASNKRIVVFGHTHIAKISTSNNYNGQKSIYANSGSWIDNTPGRTARNFVVITPQRADVNMQTKVKLYNYIGDVVTLMAEDSLLF